MSEVSKFVISKGVLKQYCGNDEVMIIPEGVKIIGKEILGYKSGENVRKVIVPEGVIEISKRAFSNSNIEEISLPNSLIRIGANAFSRCEKLRNISIPDNVKVISESSFWGSGLQQIILPKNLEEIEADAFKLCENLKDVNVLQLNSTKLGKGSFVGCKSLVDENGLFILQNRLFMYYSNEKYKYVVIPNSITHIEDGAFSNSGVVHLEMSIHCPHWNQAGFAKMYGFARSLLEYSDSSITFRDDNGNKIACVVLANEDESEPKANGAILSIQSENGMFNFNKYDAYFSSLTKPINKVKIAFVRLMYPYQVSDEMMEVYKNYLKKQVVLLGNELIDGNNVKLLNKLVEMDVLSVNNVMKLIDYAISKNKIECSALLLECKNKVFGDKNVNQPKLTFSKPKKENSGLSISDWRKLYKFKYYDEHIIITGYKGEEECVVIPEMMGSKYVIGIGSYAFDFGTSKKVKKIVLPKTISIIESCAFMGLKNVEIEICEGVKELPKDVFFVVENLHIKVPNSIEYMDEQFGDSYIETIQMEVVRNSYAENYCKKHNLQFISVDAIETKRFELPNKENEIVRPWKKPKAGTHLLSRYKGNETVVTFPIEVDGISITGIANTAGETPNNYRKIKSIILPEGYTYIGKKAFSNCENLETIVLPSTIQEISSQAFAGCKKLKELVLRKEIYFSGNDIFMDANIETVIFESTKDYKVPSHLFFNCDIKNFVVVGGSFLSNSNVFDYTGISSGISYANNMNYGKFPEAVYINDVFSTYDIKGIGEKNIQRIFMLSQFDETNVVNEEFRKRILEEKNTV